jgi:tetratricopeptide (TPR) repeat protein
MEREILDGRNSYPSSHPENGLLERFMRNEVDGQERLRIVRHLLAGCSRCVAVTRHLWNLGEAATKSGAGYAGVFALVADRGSRGERQARADLRAAPLRFSELLALMPAEGRARIESEPRLQTPAICEILIRESRAAGAPALAVVRAEWAVAAAGRVDARRYGVTLTRSLLGRSWASLGNARRLAGDLPGAETALTQAAAPLEEGSDPLESAELQELRARLLADQGKLEEAEHLLDRALILYRTLGEPHLQGRLLIQKGTIRGWAPGAEAALEAIGCLEEGLALLDQDQDQNEKQELPLVAFGLHRLALLLADAGRAEEAARALRRARPLYEQQGDGPNLVRLRHLEGKIAEALDASDAAEAAFLEARQGFLAEGLGMEAAGVLFDLAIFYTRRGRSPELRPLAQDLMPILQTRDIRQGVAAALLFFRRLVETGHATLEVLSEVSRYVSGPPRARWPALR